MPNMLRRLHIAISLAFTAAAVLCTAYCLSIFLRPGNSKSGILTMTFNFPTLHIRDTLLAPGEHMNEPRGNIFDSVQSKLQSAASFAATAVPSAVSSAINDVETAVNSLIPKNCTLGTNYLCVGFSDRIDCSPLPLSNSHPISGALSNLPTEQIQSLQPLSESLENLDRTISAVTSQDFKIYFTFGLVSAILAIVLGVLFLCSISLEAFRVIYHVFGFAIPVVAVLRAFFGFVCFLAFLIPSIFLWILFSKCSKFPFEVEQGEVRAFCVGAFILAAIMFTLTTVSEITEKRLRSK
ncbi:hypothetical protein K469DRAFT_752091 [Zopfia rhizophila CBS 207.26]|uniref:Uncharacterized protein n=1 Tax=Zopfia rhizophila CBS 207.26 TaxID=1314779 RepID=A0A6A6DSJ9_9PEZI|nr:hypothetical protein K469DRAFT_752091 [Zopfia rhizophila CBS 207.26]